MYIVKTPEKWRIYGIFQDGLGAARAVLSRYLGSATADDFIIRTFSITTCVCMEHPGL